MVELHMWHVLLVAVALLLAACGAAETTSIDSSEQVSTAMPSADAGDGSGERQAEPVAEIVEILNAESYVDDRTALSGQAIARDAELSTDDTGSFEFAFRGVRAECVMVSGSIALVVSQDRLLLSQVIGETVCEVDSPDDPVLFENNGRTIEVERGTFRLTAAETGGGAAVLDGSAKAVNPDTGETVAMGPRDSTGWDNTGDLDADSEPGPTTGEVADGIRALGEDSEGTDSGDASSSSGGSNGTDAESDGNATETTGDSSVDQSNGGDTPEDSTSAEDENNGGDEENAKSGGNTGVEAEQDAQVPDRTQADEDVSQAQ
jgi:hypothetical protein